MRKRTRTIALATALILLAFTVRTDVAYGATEIETDRTDCSIIFDLALNIFQKDEIQEPETGEDDAADSFDELESLPIEVELYRVADVNISGAYIQPKNDTGLYEALGTELGGVNASTTAAQWEAMAKTAWEKAEELAVSPTKTTIINEPNPGDGTTIEGLGTGLYLVVAKDVQSPEYLYHFTPYLVSLPGNAYEQTGDSDDWLYEVTVGLKPGREERFGDLKITKTLHTFNATLGGATFIFHIEARKGDILVYSDVVSLVFNQAGTETITIGEKIPAGAVVTVTEVYTGASYEVTSGATQTVTIEANDPDNPREPASVAFTNDYDERLNGGTSVVNLFDFTKTEDHAQAQPDAAEGSGAQTVTGVWDWKQLTDSRQEPQEAGGQ